MKWQIPAKTFLVGEYAALANKSAILLTTTPCFELSLEPSEINVIHPESPAGLWLKKQKIDIQLTWKDPYQGQGGLGASSAQFLSCYLATCYLQNKAFELEQMLEAYESCAYLGKGLKPSGYDVIAQSQQDCVYINKQQGIIESYTWPFKSLSFVLIHTGSKLATHQHLQESTLPSSIDILSLIVEDTKKAFETNNDAQFISSINHYHHQLAQSKLVATHSLELIEEFKTWPETLAIKGCGALGADVLLFICAHELRESLSNKLTSLGFNLLANEENLFRIYRNKNS